MRELGGTSNLPGVATEIARRFLSQVPLKSVATLVVTSGGVATSEQITPFTSGLDVLQMIYKSPYSNGGYTVNFSGDELRFQMA